MGYQSRLPAAPLKRELRLARRRYGDTWEEFAGRLRISPRTLTRLLASREISEPVADRIACRLRAASAPDLAAPVAAARARAERRLVQKGARMNITVARKQLAAAVRAVMPAAAKRATLPILAGVLLDASPSGLALEATAFL